MKIVTAENLTDEEIRGWLANLPIGHYSTQWYVDAMGPASASHPHRKANARREVAAAINARAKADTK